MANNKILENSDASFSKPEIPGHPDLVRWASNFNFNREGRYKMNEELIKESPETSSKRQSEIEDQRESFLKLRLRDHKRDGDRGQTLMETKKVR